MKFTGADKIELKKVTEDDCGFIVSLFDNDEYELYFSENETIETEWKERLISSINTAKSNNT